MDDGGLKSEISPVLTTSATPIVVIDERSMKLDNFNKLYVFLNIDSTFNHYLDMINYACSLCTGFPLN